MTVAHVARDWLDSRVGLAHSSRIQYRSRVDRIIDDLGTLGIADVAPADVRAWVRDLADEFAPSTTGIYLHVLRLVLDHGGQDPNAARHRSVKLPKGRSSNVRIRLPSSAELECIAATLPAHHRRLLAFLEDTGLRIQEACALDWSDVEAHLVRGKKRSSSLRWVDGHVHRIRPSTSRAARVACSARPQAGSGALSRMPACAPAHTTTRRMTCAISTAAASCTPEPARPMWPARLGHACGAGRPASASPATASTSPSPPSPTFCARSGPATCPMRRRASRCTAGSTSSHTPSSGPTASRYDSSRERGGPA